MSDEISSTTVEEIDSLPARLLNLRYDPKPDHAGTGESIGQVGAQNLPG